MLIPSSSSCGGGGGGIAGQGLTSSAPSVLGWGTHWKGGPGSEKSMYFQEFQEIVWKLKFLYFDSAINRWEINKKLIRNAFLFCNFNNKNLEWAQVPKTRSLTEYTVVQRHSGVSVRQPLSWQCGAHSTNTDGEETVRTCCCYRRESENHYT